MAAVAHLMVDAGLIVIVACIAPLKGQREKARLLFESEQFFEVFVDAPIDICESRDTKGLYKKAREGLIINFTGIDSPYEIPEKPDIRIDTSLCTPSESAMHVFREIQGYCTS